MPSGPCLWSQGGQVVPCQSCCKGVSDGVVVGLVDAWGWKARWLVGECGRHPRIAYKMGHESMQMRMR
jgi:hypothetical protein